TNEPVGMLISAINEDEIHFRINENMKNWIYSEWITIFNLYKKIKDFLNESNYKVMREFYGVDNIKNIVINLRPYFEEGEVYKHWFKESISIQDIIDDKHVVFSFGMGDSTETMENSKSVALR